MVGFVTIGSAVIVLGTFTDAAASLLRVGDKIAEFFQEPDKPITQQPPRPAGFLRLSANSALSLEPGQPFMYAWRRRSEEQTACQLSVNTGDVSGIDVEGVSYEIDAGHPWYPTPERPTVLVFSCTDGTTTTSDIGVVSIAPPTSPGWSTSSEQLAQLSILLMQDSSAAAVARVIYEVRTLQATGLSANDEVRSAILLFQAYRNQNDTRRGCAALRLVIPIGKESDYAKGFDTLLTNHCVR